MDHYPGCPADWNTCMACMQQTCYNTSCYYLLRKSEKYKKNLEVPLTISKYLKGGPCSTVLKGAVSWNAAKSGYCKTPVKSNVKITT